VQTLLQLDLETASPNQFSERFRAAFPGAEEVQRKSVALFLSAARDAGIKSSEYIMKNKKPHSAPTKKRNKSSGGDESQVFAGCGIVK